MLPPPFSWRAAAPEWQTSAAYRTRRWGLREKYPPEAACRPEQIFRDDKAQHADVEIPHIPRRACLPIGVDQSTNGTEGEPNHHAAPDQVGENIPEDAVERQQRHAERRRKPCPAAAEAAFLCSGQRGLQNVQENYAAPSRTPRHKDPGRGIEQQQIQRPVERAKGKAAVEAQQQEYACRPLFR